MEPATSNIDKDEIARFDALASRWWDPHGEFRPLHEINPLRLDYIQGKAKLEGSLVADLGCGGGILAEAMARAGAVVTGIDMAAAPLAVAKLHVAAAGFEIEYRQTTAEALADERPAHYDVVTCMEMLEHVPSPASVVDACARLVRPGGHVFFATINRNPKSFAFAILGAEYLLRMLPRGTHEYAKFIRPSELAEWGRDAGLDLRHSIGMHYNPLMREYSLGPNVDVNYLMHFKRPDNE
jgi:2-polyprenyl-6-hydroxyphenyl methylase/3-demethylubiquinone-9 3-methyltransferase